MKYIIVLLFSIGINAQSFEFNCFDFDINNHYSYNRMFKEQAKLYGHNFDDLTVAYQFVEQENLGSTNYDCNALNPAVVRLDPRWRDLPTQLKARVIFHELGHTAMLYNHTNINHPENNADPNDNSQIMWVPQSIDQLLSLDYNWNDFLNSLPDFFNFETQFRKQNLLCEHIAPTVEHFVESFDLKHIGSNMYIDSTTVSMDNKWIDILLEENNDLLESLNTKFSESSLISNTTVVLYDDPFRHSAFFGGSTNGINGYIFINIGRDVPDRWGYTGHERNLQHEYGHAFHFANDNAITPTLLRTFNSVEWHPLLRDDYYRSSAFELFATSLHFYLGKIPSNLRHEDVYNNNIKPLIDSLRTDI